MNKDRLVVKDNSLIDACFNLSLIEHRLMLLAVVEARELPNLTSETPVEVKALTYREQYNTDQSEAYKQLADASKQLFNRQFSYIDRYEDTDAVTVSRWVNEVTYVKEKGLVVLYLNRNVIEMITRLESQFTRYHLNQVSNLTSQYSIRLYEIVAKWITTGQTQKYEIQYLRSLLGIESDEYKTMSNFKSRVLDRAVNEVNEKTDIRVQYDQVKQGRTISHIQFKIKRKVTKATKPLTRLTAKQIDMFSDKLSRLPSFQSHFVAAIGANTEQYKEQIATKLEEDFYVEQWLPYLEEVGFKLPH